MNLLGMQCCLILPATSRKPKDHLYLYWCAAASSISQCPIPLSIALAFKSVTWTLHWIMQIFCIVKTFEQASSWFKFCWSWEGVSWTASNRCQFTSQLYTRHWIFFDFFASLLICSLFTLTDMHRYAVTIFYCNMLFPR